MGEGSPKIVNSLKRFLRLPVNQKERIHNGYIALVSASFAVFLVLLGGLSSQPLFGILFAVLFGISSWFVFKKQPSKKSCGIILLVFAVLSFVNIFSGLGVFSSFIFRLGITLSAIISLWKFGGIAYSLLAQNNQKD